jgi:3'-5' exoribonuclease
MKYIESLRPNMQINEVYLCKSKQQAMTKAGRPYENVTLQDKTGSLDAKIWDPDNPGIAEFEAMDYVCVSGEVTQFQGRNQLNIRRARIADENEYDPKDYLPTSEQNADDMYARLLAYIDSIQNPYLKQLLDSFFREENFAKDFRKHSAAKTIHHGFIGGLLQHTLAVTDFCNYLASAYPILNRDLLLTAAMFHDIGKVKELAAFPQNDYTDEGQLIGHIVIGMEMVSERIKTIEGFPVNMANELKHCILAHHGELEYGSPKKPALAEAIALSIADNADAKLETLTEAFAKVEPGNLSWQGYNRLFESNLRRTSEI